MIALVILAALALWLGLGFFVFARLTKSMRPSLLRSAFGFAFGAVWLLGPFADELVGSYKFNRHCQQLPKMAILGRLELGAGTFFDGNGTPRWKNREEFDDLSKPTYPAFNALVDLRSETVSLAGYPFPITKRTGTFFDARNGTKLYEYVQLHSYGGILMRTTQLGYMLEHNCSSPGERPSHEDLVVYRADASPEAVNKKISRPPD